MPDNVAKALAIIMDGEGISISKRRITLSTAGVVPMIERCGRELGVNLAISLHAVTDELRDRLVPLNRKYPIAALMAACRAYPGLSNARRITFEYVMLDGVNDSLEHAKQLAQVVKDVPCKVNLIPFNSFPGTEYRRSAQPVIDRFAELLWQRGIVTITRRTRGDDIDAACGQLAGKVQDRIRRAERRGETLETQP